VYSFIYFTRDILWDNKNIVLYYSFQSTHAFAKWETLFHFWFHFGNFVTSQSTTWNSFICLSSFVQWNGQMIRFSCMKFSFCFHTLSRDRNNNMKEVTRMMSTFGSRKHDPTYSTMIQTKHKFVHIHLCRAKSRLQFFHVVNLWTCVSVNLSLFLFLLSYYIEHKKPKTRYIYVYTYIYHI
jgi:hypothetical protein